MTKKISHNMGHKRLRVLKLSHVHIRLNYFTSLAVFTSEPFFNTYASVAAVSKAGLALSVRMLRTTRRTGARILRINIAACFQTSLAKSLHYTSFPGLSSMIAWTGLYTCPHIYFFCKLMQTFSYRQVWRMFTPDQTVQTTI